MTHRTTTVLALLAVLALSLVPGCTGADTTEMESGQTATQQPAAGQPPAGQPPAGGPPATTSSGSVEVTDFGPQETIATIALPSPVTDGDVSVEAAMAGRRSVREFAGTPLTIDQISQMFWAAQGITSEDGKRTAPSAMKSYPLEVYVVAYDVDGLEPGVYKYIPQGHQAALIKQGDQKSAMGTRNNSAADFVVAANFTKLTSMVGAMGERFAVLEAGHAAQNMCLEATALGIGTVTTAGFSEDSVRSTLNLPAAVTPSYVMPTGNLP
jgi:SagB-type dehydrogenase family enzyme